MDSSPPKLVEAATSAKIEKKFAEKYMHHLVQTATVQQITKGEPIEFNFDLNSLQREVEKEARGTHAKAAKVSPQFPKDESVDYQEWLATTRWAYEGRPFSAGAEQRDEGATGVDQSIAVPPRVDQVRPRAQDEDAILVKGFKKLFRL
jgi:hypothetical protein